MSARGATVGTEGRGHVREERAAAFAALAEGCVLGSPVNLVLGGASGGGAAGLALFLPVFVAGFVGAVVLAVRHRHSGAVGPVAAAAAVVLGLVAGRSGLDRAAFGVLVSLLVAGRAVTLSMRDWRVPIGVSALVGGVALGAEAIASGGPQSDWRVMLVVAIPVWLAAVLASRAATVWAAGDARDLPEDERRSGDRSAGRLALALAGATAGIVLVGAQGGVLARLGSLLAPFGRAAVALFTGILAQVARPVFWLAQRIHVDPTTVQKILQQLRRNALAARGQAAQQSPSGTPMGRVIALLLVLGIVTLGVRWLRRIRPRMEDPIRDRQPPGTTAVTPMPELDADPAPRRSMRSALAADRVRRWYAEVLAVAADAGLPKEHRETPAEFADRIGGRLPDAAADLHGLTRAYEDVRYGERAIEPSMLRRTEAHHRALIRALRQVRQVRRARS